MSDELQEVCEHWLSCEWKDDETPRHDLVIDLARAYLAEHPADDGEAVTVEWLRNVGFKSPPSNPQCPFMFLESPYDDVLKIAAYISVSGRDIPFGEIGLEVNDIEIKTHHEGKRATRGDVRLLAKVLGIELKEPTT
jgi:hypothetical protein